MTFNKISILLLAVLLAGQDDLPGQVESAGEPVEAVQPRIASPFSGAVLDRRLVVPPPITRQGDVARLTEEGAELLQPRESRLRYPLVGALIGGVAGAVYASIEHSGENALGFPVEPVLIFAPLGAITGALVGAIIDPNAER